MIDRVAGYALARLGMFGVGSALCIWCGVGLAHHWREDSDDLCYQLMTSE